MTEISKFSAAGSALGYIAQVDLALLVLLRAMDGSSQNFAVSLETFDDIVIHEPDDAGSVSLIQSKQHISDGGVGDMDPELWKTLHNWIVEPGNRRAHLILITTRVPTENTAAKWLADGAARDVYKAHEALLDAAKWSTNQGLMEYFESFQELSDADRTAFLGRVTIVGGESKAEQLQVAINAALRKAAPPDRRAALVEGLCGWWHDRAARHLAGVARGTVEPISVDEVEAKLWAIQKGLRDDALPIDTAEVAWPSSAEVASDERLFVAQLRRIALASRWLGQCIYDHNRAFQQRSYWQRLNLLNVGELQSYDEILRDEWRRHFTSLADDCEELEDDREVCRLAREGFKRLNTSPLPKIRSGVREPYTAYGSMHILADRALVGWHPNWSQHVSDGLGLRERPEGAA